MAIMLLVGMLLANVPVVKTVGRLDSNWSSVIRSEWGTEFFIMVRLTVSD